MLKLQLSYKLGRHKAIILLPENIAEVYCFAQCSHLAVKLNH